MTQQKKICSPSKGCGLEKGVGEFRKKGDGYRHTCKECEKLYKKQYSLNNLEKGMLRNSRKRARKKCLEHNITLEDIQIPEYCPVLGIKLESAIGRGNKCAMQQDSSPTLDRMDNSKGYVKGNIMVISWRANMLKSDATIEELEKLLRYMRGQSVDSVDTAHTANPADTA